MYLKGNISASSITEVVIAVAVIAACIGVSAMVFARTIRVTTDFESIRMQTELQSVLWKKMVLNVESETIEGAVLVKEDDLVNDSLRVITVLGTNEKLLWTQHWLKHE